MDYKKNIKNKKNIEAMKNKLSDFTKNIDSKIKEIVNDADVLIEENSEKMKEYFNKKSNSFFKKNMYSLAILYVEKNIMENGAKDIDIIIISNNDEDEEEYLTVKNILNEICKEYNIQDDTYLSLECREIVYKVLEMYFKNSKEDINFLSLEKDTFSLTLNLSDEAEKVDDFM